MWGSPPIGPAAMADEAAGRMSSVPGPALQAPILRGVLDPALRVLHVFQPPDGGVPQHVADLAEGLQDNGVQVAVAGPPDAAVRERLSARMAYETLPIVGSMAAPGPDVATLRRLTALLRRDRFDLVHTHAQKAGVLGRLAARRMGVPALYTPNSLVYRTQLLRSRRGAGVRYRLGRSVERALGRRSAAIVAVADEERRVAIADGLAPPERIHVINNGVARDLQGAPDPQLSAFRGEGPLLGFVAGLRDQKGLPTLLEALELLAAEGGPPRFAIVGNGPLWGEVQTRLRSGPAGDTTLLVPFAGRPEPYLAALDAYVLPSYWEGLPIAVLEAMMMGLPVVATSVNGTPEAVVEGETGYLVPPRDPRALATRLRAVAEDADRRARMGARAREVALERFTVEGMVSHTLELYRRIARPSA